MLLFAYILISVLWQWQLCNWSYLSLTIPCLARFLVKNKFSDQIEIVSTIFQPEKVWDGSTRCTDSIIHWFSICQKSWHWVLILSIKDICWYISANPQWFHLDFKTLFLSSMMKRDLKKHILTALWSSR